MGHITSLYFLLKKKSRPHKAFVFKIKFSIEKVRKVESQKFKKIR
jgi:hypothetical protein